MGKVIVITGASAGIGAELARQLGAQGHSLVLAARRKAELEQVARTAGSSTKVVVTDVTRRADVERLRDEAIAAFGHVDVWINNAGRGIGKPALELTDDDVDQMILVNVKSALYGMQAIVPHFQKRGAGHLINISSFLGRVPMASVRSVYSASKAALNSLTANVRMDLALSAPNVHVSVVMPGMVSTEFARNALHGTQGGPPPPAAVAASIQTAEQVAASIVGLIEKPAPELFTNPAHAEVARRYYADISAAEASMRHPRS